MEFRNVDWNISSRNRSINSYVNDADSIAKVALAILDQEWPVDPCRRISLRITNLEKKDARNTVLDKFVRKEPEEVKIPAKFTPIGK